MAVFSLPYLPNIAWFQHAYKQQEILIDKHENYVKQTYKNRCYILGANGLQQLIIPVKHQSASKIPFYLLEPNNSQNWQNQHWQSIVSAYGKSPYFFHYRHYFEPIYTKEISNIFSLNLELVQLIIKLLRVEISLTFSQKYIQNHNTDFRNYFNSKHNEPSELIFNKPYLQVFTEKFSFIPNLSILDLLFTQGPRAIYYLTQN